jgi:5-formyltetrahydrofolate cyclo-ligase
MDKSILRKDYLFLRKSLSKKERESRDSVIADRLFDEFDLSDVQFLHIFLSIEKFAEVRTLPMVVRLWRDFPAISTVVPRINSEKSSLEHLLYDRNANLIENSWGILEPAGNDFVEIEKIDLVLVPLLAFDRRGFRVGYGKGYYDKFLCQCRDDCLKVGLSYFPPVEEISDVNDFDIKLDFCITPEKVWKF